jgi:uncharacterized membrane protein YvlD (DUF360 family)
VTRVLYGDIFVGIIPTLSELGFPLSEFMLLFFTLIVDQVTGWLFFFIASEEGQVLLFWTACACFATARKRYTDDE